MTEHAGGEWRPWAKAAPMNVAVRSREVPSFVAITLKTGSGWTDGAGVCSICTAIVLDREAHRVWHGQRTYSQGGIIWDTPPMQLRYVAEPSPDGNGRPGIVFADECFINKDRVCIRRDDLHAAVPGAVRNRRDRWWFCPLHDGEPRP